jgi:hypothetical protein
VNFEQEIRKLQDTALVVAEIRRRQAAVQKMQAEGMELHEKRMAHIDMRLAEITDKLWLHGRLLQRAELAPLIS